MQKLFKSIWDNSGTFFLAFMLALAVWVSAVIAEDPNITQEYPGGIRVEFENFLEDQFVVINQIPDFIDLTLRAPDSVWNLLTEEENNVVAKLNLKGITSGEHLLELEIVGLENLPVQIISINPLELSVVIEKVLYKEFNIKVLYLGEPALGYQLVSLGLSESIVNVAGPESLVNKIETVKITVDVSGLRETLKTEMILIPVDEEGGVILGLNLLPESVTIDQEIIQSGGYRDVAVVVETIGNLANGYRITNITVFPRTVTLFSNNPETVAELPGFISTLPLDLTDANDDIETRISLDLPEGVVLVGDEQSVQVQVGIAAIDTGVTLTVPVEIIGLGPGLQAVVSPESVDVFLFGALSVLDDLDQEDVRIFVNLTDIGVGTHLIIPQEEILPEGIVVDAIAPDTIQVVISESSEEE